MPAKSSANTENRSLRAPLEYLPFVVRWWCVERRAPGPLLSALLMLEAGASTSACMRKGGWQESLNESRMQNQMQ